MKQKIKAKIIDNGLFISGSSMPKSKSQNHVLKCLIEDGDIKRALSYMMSFNSDGYNERVRNIRPQNHGIDKLSLKRKNSVLSYFDLLIDPSGEHSPGDTERVMKSKYKDFIGVEIECFIPFSSVDVESEPAYCECYDCGGSGEVVDEDNQGDDDEPNYHECSSCDGTGQVEDEDSSSHSEDEDSARRALKRLIKAKKIKTVSIVDDGSIDAISGYFPVEIRVLTRLSKPHNLGQVCSLLKSLGAKVNKSCGLHVHYDYRGSTNEQVIDAGIKMKRALPVLAAMVPKSRRTNEQYCAMGVSKLNGCRYHAVNLTSFQKHGTIEVRLHSGTTEFIKIMNWARLCDSILKTDWISPSVSTLNELTDHVKLDEDLIEYISQRTALFNNGQGVNPSAHDHDSTETQLEMGA